MAAHKKTVYKTRLLLVIAGPLLGFSTFFVPHQAGAANLQNRTIQISSSLPAASNVQYGVGFSLGSNQTLGSVAVEICSNSPLPEIACQPASGFSWLGSTLNSQSGVSGMAINAATTSTKLVLGGVASGFSSGHGLSFVVTTPSNPSTVGTFYARVYTYPSTNGTGLYSDAGGVALSLADHVSVSAVVPPFLYFCSGINITGVNCATATGSYLDFGEFSTTSPAVLKSQILIGTNAPGGYSISVSGITPTSGNNTIASLANPTQSTAGQPQFGMNLRGNTNPAIGADVSGDGVGRPTTGYNTANLFKFVSNDTIASSNRETDHNMYTVSYLINIGQQQPPGVYATTLLYTALASF